jgi:hypothetical protein
MNRTSDKNAPLNWHTSRRPPVPIDSTNPFQFDPADFQKNPLEIAKEIMKARENWAGLGYEEKLRITQMTHAILPESFRPEEWEEEQETMKTYYNHVPPIIDHFISRATESQVFEVLSRFFAKKQLEQGGNPASLEGLKFDGEEVNLSADLIHKIDQFRSKGN